MVGANESTTHLDYAYEQVKYFSFWIFSRYGVSDSGEEHNVNKMSNNSSDNIERLIRSI